MNIGPYELHIATLSHALFSPEPNTVELRSGSKIFLKYHTTFHTMAVSSLGLFHVLYGILPLAVQSFVLSQSNGTDQWRLFALRRARDLVKGLVEDDLCFESITGAQAFANACDLNVVFEDRFEPQPIVGRSAVLDHLQKKIHERRKVRIDKISDGDAACGFAWTWVSNDEEGLRGTTFVELNSNGEIQYVQEIPEPIFKPGDLTQKLLKTLTADSEWKPFQPYEKKTPTKACDLAKYLFSDLQAADPAQSLDEFMRFVDKDIMYRDFNYENIMKGPDEVRKFVDDFRFPGIEFRPLRFDDGEHSTCFTWEVVLDDAPDTINGMSFYELDPESRKIVYVRDVPVSAIKPPILGKLARQMRPGIGEFSGVPLCSMSQGM